MANLNKLARHFASLHISGNPIVLPNVYDTITANAVLSLRPQIKAIATASYGIASAQGLTDYTMSMDTHLEAVLRIRDCVNAAEVDATNPEIPFSVDIINAYGPELRTAITKIIELGAVGCNIEDSYPKNNYLVLYSVEEMKRRLLEAKKVATELGVPDFVFNIRSDSAFVIDDGKQGGSVDDVIARGKAYLSIGVPTTIFLWSGPFGSGTSSTDLKRALKELDNKVSVKLKMGEEGGLSVDELATLGVSRISIGPSLMFMATELTKQVSKRILEGGKLSVAGGHWSS